MLRLLLLAALIGFLSVSVRAEDPKLLGSLRVGNRIGFPVVDFVNDEPIESTRSLVSGKLGGEEIEGLAVSSRKSRYADGEPPAHLTELATRLKASGGTVEVARVDRANWELSVDFRTKIADDALKPLHDVRGVTAIRILKGGVSDSGLAHLRNLPDLKLLVVDSKEVSDAGMKTIGTLKSLTKLDLIQPRLTAKGLGELAALKELKELYLYGADIRDEEIDPLKKLGQLQWLYVPATVTKTKYEEIRRALPKTQVKRFEKP